MARRVMCGVCKERPATLRGECLIELYGSESCCSECMTHIAVEDLDEETKARLKKEIDELEKERE